MHLIVTMNTIKSNMQFFARAKVRFAGGICIFNSIKGSERSEYDQTNSMEELLEKIEGGTKIIIMCGGNGV